jgi:hypothetical protein
MSSDFPERDRIARSGPEASGPADLTVIDALIGEYRAALDAAPPGGRGRQAYALAFAWNQRYQRTQDLADIRAAVPFLRMAVDESDGDPFAARYVSELGAALNSLADGEPASETVHRDEVVSLTERAASMTPVGHPQHAMRVSQHGLALCQRGRQRSSVDDLDRGVERLREAVDGAHPGDPRRSVYLMQLAAGLTLRGQHTDSLDDLDEAFAAIDLAGLVAHPYDLFTQPIPLIWNGIRAARAQRRRRGP